MRVVIGTLLQTHQCSSQPHRLLQICSRKAELKKLNFSILANYLDLLDIITRDPSSLKRKEKLDHIGQLFINMHHLLNEYRPHQARDLLREMLTYQVVHSYRLQTD